jgi:hypothetical protein
VKAWDRAVGSWAMGSADWRLRRTSCACGQKKDLLATPFQRCLHGEKAAVSEVEVPWRVSVSSSSVSSRYWGSSGSSDRARVRRVTVRGRDSSDANAW